MAINVIHGGTVDSFDYLAFPEQNPMNASYIQNQISSLSDSLTEFGRNFMHTAKDLYERVNDSHAMNLARAAVRRAKSMFHPNTIRYLETGDELRSAQPVMQRFIMAHPELRTKYHKQLVDGYSDTYTDLEPGKVGKVHLDYRVATSGMIVNAEAADEDASWTATIYTDELHPSDRELHFTEKVDIMRTWDVIDAFLAAGKDPSNPFEVD